MVKKAYKVDLDYESFLFDPNYFEENPANLKIIKEFEYVFFLINKDQAILKNIKTYQKSYLENLDLLGFVIPECNSLIKDFEYWWGHREDRELSKKLNSKLTSAKIALQNNWGFKEGAIVKDLNELQNHLLKFPHIDNWLLKRPNGFSGIGHYSFQSHSYDEKYLSKLLVEEHLLEPAYERLFDIGTTFEIENGIIKNQFMVENFNSKKGSFKGGAGANNVEKFKKYIFLKYQYSLDELERITREVADYYIGLGADSNIQIDSFVYLEEGQMKLYALVEVNYRKTMGLVIQSLANKFPEADWVEWKIESVKKLKENPMEKEWIRLSPKDNHFQSFMKPSS